MVPEGSVIIMVIIIIKVKILLMVRTGPAKM